jgi:hypothetical protein
MPRDVSVRDSYDADAAHLARVRRSIELDKRRDLKWRREAMEALRKAMMLLYNAPSVDGKLTRKQEVKR